MKLASTLILLAILNACALAGDKRWDKTEITWKADSDYLRGPAEQAFKIWSAAVGGHLTFTQAETPDILISDKREQVSVLGSSYLGATYVFAPDGITIEHAEIEINMDNPTAILGVLLHEEGHALGLSHSKEPKAVMFPTSSGFTTLHKDDTLAICSLYGVQPVAPDIELSIVKIGKKRYAFYASQTVDLTMHNNGEQWLSFTFPNISVLTKGYQFHGPYPFSVTAEYRGWQKEFPIEPIRKNYKSKAK